MNIKELTNQVETHCNCKVTWDLGNKYTATCTTTGAVVAEYNPKTGKLVYR